MAELINSNDITQDIDNSDIKHSGPFPTDESEVSSRSREEDNQISMHIGDVNITNSEIKLHLTVYGNDMRIKQPNKIGGVYSFLFINGDPLIILGPQCKI
jgi:hypothetical protein